MPAVIRIPVESSLATQAVNIWHWIVPNSALTTEANNAIAALDTFYTSLQTSWATQTFTIGSRVVTVDQSPNLIVGATSQTSGGTAATPAVLSACAVARLYSGVVGGSHRGRKYLGPLGSGLIASNGRELTGSAITSITAALGTLAATTTGGIQLAVWSETQHQATAVTGVGTATTLGTQRRRLT